MLLTTQCLQMTSLGKQCFGGVVTLSYSPAVKNHILNLQGGEQFLVDPVQALKEGQSPYQPIPDTTTPIRRRKTISTTTSILGSQHIWSIIKFIF